MSARQVAWPWNELGLKGRVTLREVKRAYAARLREIDRDNPEAFQALSLAFVQAKRQAKPDAAAAPEEKAARPSMSSLAYGIDDPEPAFFETTKEAIDLPDTSMPHDDEIVTTIEDAVTPQADLPPAAQTSTAPPDPWKTPQNTPLTELFENNPVEAEKEFWRRFHEAARWKWKVGELDKLLALDFARTRWVRLEMERTIFNSLVSNMRDLSWGMARADAIWLEENFGWGSDGVGMQKRLGRGQNTQMLIHAMSLGLPNPERQEESESMVRLNLFKFGTFLVPWTVSVATWGQRLNPEQVIGAGIATAILFAASFFVMMFLVPIIRKIGSTLGINVPLMNAFRKMAPRLTRRMDLNPKIWDLVPWCLAGVATSIMFALAWFGA